MMNMTTKYAKKRNIEDVFSALVPLRISIAGTLPTASPMPTPRMRLMFVSNDEPDVSEKMKEVATTQPML